MSLMKRIADIFGIEDQPKKDNIGDLIDAAPSENRITVIGTMGAGKSTHLAGLLVAADRLVSKSRDTEYPFRYYLREGSANIEHDKSALRAGHFPPKTAALNASTIEQRITFEWAHEKILPGGKRLPIWKRQADVPICDLAGEDLCLLIERINRMRTLEQAAALSANRILSMIVNSSGLLIVIKATRAQGLGIELEKEPTSLPGLSEYSDANMKRMIDGIVRYKKQNPASPPLKGVAIIVTAWDALAPVAEQISMITGKKFDPLDVNLSQESLDKFVYACFPSTHAAIASLNIRNVRYFPSFFEVERDSNGEPVCWPGTNSPKIKKPAIFDPNRSWEDNVNTVLNSEYWFFQELEWLRNFASLR